MASAKVTYSNSGVDIRTIHSIQARINSQIARTANTYTPHFITGHYAGVFEVSGVKMCVHADGVGSKILTAQHVGRHDTVGIDAVAMNANDIICMGARPIIGVDYLALSRADDVLVEQIMRGLVEGCRQAGIALVGGETAILPDMIKGEPPIGPGAKSGKGKIHADYDLAMTVVGTFEHGEIITGDKMRKGDVLIGLTSSGLHSNGFSLARKLLNVRKWGPEMIAPTRIYVRPVLDMVYSGHVHGLAHITGGAFSKLSRIGKHGNVGFVLDNMPKPTGLFVELQRKVKDDYELYRTFNMGVGMVVACAPSSVPTIAAIAAKYDVGASKIGYVDDGSDVILQKGGKRISLLKE